MGRVLSISIPFCLAMAVTLLERTARAFLQSLHGIPTHDNNFQPRGGTSTAPQINRSKK